MSARAHWDARYRAGDHAGREPCAFLADIAPLLPARGRALDLAGGAGRHALWLARRGLEVTLVDVSAVALELARARADEAHLPLELRALDLEHDAVPPGPWALACTFHYLERSLFARLAAELEPGALLVCTQPTVTNLERHARPSRRFLVEPGELATLAETARATPDGPAAFELVRYREAWSPEGVHQAELVARRRGVPRGA
ncbi:MAG: class I SAM-dependent methyltransferase [Myxococcales bacterium]|nr:class I SAM-dependent methyltransferase [Myxococcales bacterium]